MTVCKNNKLIHERYAACKDLTLTLPSSIEDELKTNPFLLAQDVDQFKEYRLKKDAF